MENIEKQIVRIIENNSAELAAEEILRLFSVVGRSEQLLSFFLWFRVNGELHIDKSIEAMIEIYLKESNLR